MAARKIFWRFIHLTPSTRGIRVPAIWSPLASRAGETTLRAEVTERIQPGVVYTTFHHPVTGANVVTTEFSDWATNCPEYKVTAVEVRLAKRMSQWQEEYLKTRRRTTQIQGAGGSSRSQQRRRCRNCPRQT